MTPQELDERIEQIEKFTMSPQVGKVVKQLIRDCIAAITPLKEDLSHGLPNEAEGFNQAVNLVEANTKELLGDKQS